MAQTPSPQQVNREKYRHMRLGDLLVETGLLTPEELKAALEEQRKRRGKKLGEILISMGLASEEAIFSTLALKFRMPFVNLEKYPINPAAVEEIPRSLIQRYHFLPINTDERTLTVAISNPTNTEIYDLLRFQVQKTIKEVLVTPSQLARGIEQVLGEGDSELGILTEDLGGELEEKEEEQINEDLLKREADEAPIVRLVNRIILQGDSEGGVRHPSLAAGPWTGAGLSGGWGSAGGQCTGSTAPASHHLAHKAPRRDGYRRASLAPGWPHLASSGRERSRDPYFGHPQYLWGIGGHADPG
ncbi:MAG: hypothetical protein D6736_07200 [Nitrospinota bacterium]|nr:MAG: hypothetical protein D6736_07200 [Nitrospinota bacterium]